MLQSPSITAYLPFFIYLNHRPPKSKLFPYTTLFRSDKLKKYQYVNDEYIQSIIEREKMSSTAFNNIVAVPHSMKMNACKTSISIIINDEPQFWVDSHVHIIALITINENERKAFRYIFDSFIKVLSEVTNTHLLIQSEDYDTFIKNLSTMMKKP